MTSSYARGFDSVEREYTRHQLTIEGDIPEWIQGRLLRNGPGRFEVGNEHVQHWFDGLAMLTKFRFHDGKITYSNRFLRSEEYRQVMERGHHASSQFGTNRQGIIRKIKDWFWPSVTDNANVNILRLGDRFIAITETQIGIEFDLATLETIQEFPFTEFAGQMMTAHPHVDPTNDEIVTFTTEFGRKSHYHFYRCSSDTNQFHSIGTLQTNRPSYVHSFGLTPGYIVFVEFPFDVHPAKLLLPGRSSFIERYNWRPDQGTRFVILDRETGRIITEYSTEPCFAFHHINAYEESNRLVVDLATFPDASLIESLYLADLKTGPLPSLDGEFTRFILPIGEGDMRRDSIYANGITLPRISPVKNTRCYQYAYAQGTPSESDRIPQRLVKIDTQAQSAKAWTEEGTYCGEPVFVPDPAGTREDDGVVLSVILEAESDESAVLVLDGRTFTELARGTLPHVVPFDFHGQFFPDATTPV